MKNWLTFLGITTLLCAVMLTGVGFTPNDACAQSQEEPPPAQDEAPGEAGGIISGCKFLDKNFNGVRDPGETGIEGVRISLQRGTDTRYATTGPDGAYSFEGLELGLYEVSVVEATVPEGHFHTNLPRRQAFLWLGCMSRTENFANGICEKKGSISGTKWEWRDDNGDAVIQAEEKYPLEGVTVRLSSPLLHATLEAETGADGGYIFPGLEPRTYTIAEVPAPDWYPVDPPDGIREVELEAGSDEGGMDFVNSRPCCISGTKWEWTDYNGNDRIDGGESRPLPGVEIRLLREGAEAAPSTVTNSIGGYSFGGLQPGTYTVEEVLTEGWSAVNPQQGTREVVLKSGINASRIDFLNSRTTLVAGEVVAPPTSPAAQSIAEGSLPRTGLNQLPLIVGAILFVLTGLISLALGLIRSRGA